MYFCAVRILFLGTPEFSVASLEAIIQAGFEVVAVVTAPDKPAGRGMQMQFSAVKQCALKHAIPVLQPVKLKDPEFLAQLASYKADIQVVIAFRMLPESVWNMPAYGTLNLHASLLPDYRGAAPINHAIIQGETKTGVCTFFLKHEIDTGDILLQREVEISEKMNAGELHDILMHLGAEVVVESLQAVASGNYTTTPQPEKNGKSAPKIFKPFCEIPWHKSAREIYNHIRGLSPYPAAHMYLSGKMLKVFQAEYIVQTHAYSNGQLISDGKSFVKVACNDGFILLKEVQLEGKKRMDIEAFLLGNKSLLPSN